MPVLIETQSAAKRVVKTPDFYRSRLTFSQVIERANERASIMEVDGKVPGELAELKAIREAINEQGVPLIVDADGAIVLDRSTVIHAFDILCRHIANIKPTPELIPIFIEHGFSPEKARELSEAPVDEDIIHREIMQRLVSIAIREQMAEMDAAYV